MTLDRFDHAILEQLQRDATPSMDELASRVNLSRNACWRRVKKLQEDGVIRSTVVILDPLKINLGLGAFISIRTAQHDMNWLSAFSAATRDIAEIVGAYRISGDTDYLLHAVVPSIEGYDQLYKRLISAVALTDVSASFVMEKIKETTVLPLLHAD